MVLLVGTAYSETVIPPFGALCIDPSSPWTFLSGGPLPSRLALAIPPGLSTPLDLVLQWVAFGPGTGNLSNPARLRIE